MDAFQLVLAALGTGTAGLCLGVIVAEWRLRDAAMRELKEAGQALRDTLTKLNSAHNSLAARIEQVQDQVNTHEFRISATGKPKGAAWPQQPA